jgi:hypothetical protein
MRSWKRAVSRIFLAALLPLTLVMTAGAATTYTLGGADYDPANRTGVYASATGVTGSFTTAAPLPPNLTNAAIAGTGGLGLVKSWSFNDGVFTYTKANSVPYQDKGIYFKVSTDAVGAITNFVIVLTIPATGAAVGQPTEFLWLGFSGLGTVNVVRANCGSVTPEGGGPAPGWCEAYFGPDVTDVANSAVPGTATFTASTTCNKVNKKGGCKNSKKHP